MARPSGRRTNQFHLPQGNPNPSVTAVQNTFIEGLKTEFTGLNFPENACTTTFDCRFNRTGEVTRRKGFDFEASNAFFSTDRTLQALSTFLWTNVGGDGNTKILVTQVGQNIYFYDYTLANTGQGLSAQKLPSFVNLSLFVTGGVYDATKECQFATGNGYLFIYQPTINPVFCSFNSNTLAITANAIPIKIRDFVGDVEPNVPDNLRPSTLNSLHQYNLQNQGWTSGSSWNAISTTYLEFNPPSLPQTFPLQVPANLVGVSTGQLVNIYLQGFYLGPDNNLSLVNATIAGIVTSYSGTTMNVQFTSISPYDTRTFLSALNRPPQGDPMSIQPQDAGGQIQKWHTQLSNYPSNADIWWEFKDATNTFNPLTTVANVTLNSGPAPKGYYIMDAFNQDRSAVSSIAGFNPVTTTSRPRTGTWFSGRVWYAGADASVTLQDVTSSPSNTVFYTWTESIYFSQIATSPSQFGRCYQTNDPTSQNLFQLLPSDGGVIIIQGSGSIYKLFPVQNGLLVFAANGIWFITGSSGIGFSATDYTITKLSGVRCISGTSFVDIDGWPVFWTEDGIYHVTPSQGGLQVQNLVIPSIRTFYNNIPLSSKKKARGAYNRVTGEVQWVYLSTEAVDLTSSYNFDRILNFYTYTGSFYPWTLPAAGATGVNIHDITYIEGPGGIGTIPSTFKYFTSLIGPTLPANPPFSLGNVAVNAAWFNSATATVTLSVNAGSVITIFVNQCNDLTPISSDPRFPSLASVTSTSGLTFQRRWGPLQQQDNHTFDDCRQGGELWWAYCPKALTSEVITATTNVTNSNTGSVLSAAEWRGLSNPQNPWSTNPSVPTPGVFNNDGALTTTNTPFSSNTASAIVLWWQMAAQACAGPPAGFTSFNPGATNVQSGYAAETRSGFLQASGFLVNQTYNNGGAGDCWMNTVDMFEQFPPPLPGVYNFTFSEERDNVNWQDWNTLANAGAAGFPVNYVSTFTTGYQLHGQATRKWQPEYVYMYTNSNTNAYKIQGVWNFANNINSNKFSTEQVVTNNSPNFDKVYRRHRIRGFGTVLQLRIQSVQGNPFSFSGWAVQEVINQNV